MAQIAGTVDPLIGTRQRREGSGRIEGLAGDGAGVELGGKGRKGWSVGAPVVERGLLGGRDTAGGDAAGQVGRDDHKLPIGATIVERC